MPEPAADPLVQARRLRQVAEALVQGSPIERTDAEWLGQALRAYLDDDDLARPLGLSTGTTGPSWRARERLAERNRLIRELAEHYAGPPTARANLMRDDLRHYASTGWPHDRQRGSAYPPTPKRTLMFAVCNVEPGKSPPSSTVQLLAIVTGE